MYISFSHPVIIIVCGNQIESEAIRVSLVDALEGFLFYIFSVETRNNILLHSDERNGYFTGMKFKNSNSQYRQKIYRPNDMKISRIDIFFKWYRSGPTPFRWFFFHSFSFFRILDIVYATKIVSPALVSVNL